MAMVIYLRLAELFRQPESDASRTPDLTARPRRGEAAAGGEADGAAGEGAG
jgi:hypothetical protein